MLAGFWFTVMAALIKAAAPTVGIAALVVSRGVVGLVLCVAAARVLKLSLRPQGRGRLAVRCLIGGAAMACYYAAVGLWQTELGTAAMLKKTSPVWVALFAPLVFGERTTPRVWLALVVGLVGVGASYGFVPEGDRVGIALCLLTGFLAAIAYLALRGLAFTDNPVAVVAAFSLTVLVGAAPFAVRNYLASSGYDLATWSMIGLAGTAGTLGQFSLTGAYRHGSAASVSVASLSEIAFALLASLLVFAQSPTPAGLVGGGLVCVAALVAVTSRQSQAESSLPEVEATNAPLD